MGKKKKSGYNPYLQTKNPQQEKDEASYGLKAKKTMLDETAFGCEEVKLSREELDELSKGTAMFGYSIDMIGSNKSDMLGKIIKSDKPKG
ncbi:MAG: hypothetical protein LBN36_02210 [Clostridiales Family XIII bacterium]|jgi:hypothetical protein|nr:hypothetical protein [Clostridiales Family XIII bacterium]